MKNFDPGYKYFYRPSSCQARPLVLTGVNNLHKGELPGQKGIGT